MICVSCFSYHGVQTASFSSVPLLTRLQNSGTLKLTLPQRKFTPWWPVGLTIDNKQ